MLKVGLTGGIGSGKSAVSELLVDRGAVLVDADLIARAVLATGSAGLATVVATFGEQVLTADGELNRPVLGQIVFGNPDLLAQLNAIVHPLVAEESARQVAAAEASGARVLVADVPLLVENHLQGLYDAVLVVSASPQTQLDRLTRLRAMSRQDAQARIDAQAPLADKLAAATHVIDNDGPLEALAPQVEAVWAALLAAAERNERQPSADLRPGETVSPPT
ncbi:MAG: dephospho-CoA kinase [Mycobacteriales bacterium]